MVARNLKDFMAINNELYHHCGGGFVARPLSITEVKEELQRVHELSCGDNDVSIYRCLKRQGYYWPRTAKEATELQSACRRL